MELIAAFICLRSQLICLQTLRVLSSHKGHCVTLLCVRAAALFILASTITVLQMPSIRINNSSLLATVIETKLCLYLLRCVACYFVSHCVLMHYRAQL